MDERVSKLSRRRLRASVARACLVLASSPTTLLTSMLLLHQHHLADLSALRPTHLGSYLETGDGIFHPALRILLLPSLDPSFSRSHS